ncbi:MAG TPA: NAD(P)-binding domain-containing protein [Chitinophagaceae bacterium]|nr:NAD(P)-binding domain-containing protein [Chitinophagaceae bacterium]
MNTVAIIGTGRLGSKLAALFAAWYPEVLWAGRDIEKTRRLVAAQSLPNLIPVTVAEALEKAQLIIGAIWYDQERDFVTRYREPLKNKIYINVSVPFNETFDDLMLPYGQSAAENIQELLPETAVLGAFKTIYWEVFGYAEEREGPLPDIYLTGNDPALRSEVAWWLHRLPYRVVDAGDLRENRTLERMTLLARKMGKRLGTYPVIGFYLWG